MDNISREIDAQERRRLRARAIARENTERKKESYNERHGIKEEVCFNCGFTGHKKDSCQRPKVARPKGQKRAAPPPDEEALALAVLGLTRADNNVTAIKSAYKRRALALHPDKNSAPEAESLFKELQQAYSYIQTRWPESTKW
jgi:hypothetical protein